MSTVFPHVFAGIPETCGLDRRLSEWKGLPVTLSVDSSDAVPAIEGAFCIRKNDVSKAVGEESLTITAADSEGFINGINFLLRAQQQRDTCLCVTLPHYDAVRISPRFALRAAVYDYGCIRNMKKARSLPEIARRDAMTGINGWIIADEDMFSGHADEMYELKEILAIHGISLYKDRESLGTTTLELSDSGNQKFMGEIWLKQMLEALSKGCTAILYHPEKPSSEHPFKEINLYAFGRLSADASAIPRRIAYEWIARTYSDNPLIVRPLMESMLNEDEAAFCTKSKEFETY